MLATSRHVPVSLELHLCSESRNFRLTGLATGCASTVSSLSAGLAGTVTTFRYILQCASSNIAARPISVLLAKKKAEPFKVVTDRLGAVILTDTSCSPLLATYRSRSSCAAASYIALYQNYRQQLYCDCAISSNVTQCIAGSVQRCRFGRLPR